MFAYLFSKSSQMFILLLSLPIILLDSKFLFVFGFYASVFFVRQRSDSTVCAKLKCKNKVL